MPRIRSRQSERRGARRGRGTLDILLSGEERAFRGEVRAYFRRLLPPQERAALSGEQMYEEATYRELVGRMGRDGWLAVGWPTEYGGLALSATHQLLFFDEAARHGVPFPVLTVNSIGPAIMHAGTEDQRRRYLPGIARGELHFAVGYSEPEAGTDLAAITTRAVRDGDAYVVDGRKLWTSLAGFADQVWLACRTGPPESRHRGISVLVVPTDSPGFDVTPVPTIAEDITTATTYDHVRVPATNRIGEENEGWSIITDQLNHERVALVPSGGLERCLEDAIAWAASTTVPGGGRVLDEGWVQRLLGAVRAKVDALALMNRRSATDQERGHRDPVAASAIKVYGTEVAIECYRALGEVVGPHALIHHDRAGARLAGRIEYGMRTALVLTFGGGANEIQRDLIATRGLGLPPPDRRVSA